LFLRLLLPMIGEASSQPLPGAGRVHWQVYLNAHPSELKLRNPV
jgi:hypothetical protein